MVSRASLRQFTLFIQPDVGPITPIQFEGELVDASALDDPQSGGVNEVVRQIRAKGAAFAQLQLDSPVARSNLLKTLQHTRVLHSITGVGVYIPGKIVGAAGGADPDAVKRLTAEWEQRLREAKTRADAERTTAVNAAYERGRHDGQAAGGGGTDVQARIAQLTTLATDIGAQRDRAVSAKGVAESALAAERDAHQRTRATAANDLAQASANAVRAEAAAAATIAALTDQVANAQHEGAMLAPQVAALNAQLATLQRDHDALKTQNESLRRRAQELEDRFAMLVATPAGPRPTRDDDDRL